MTLLGKEAMVVGDDILSCTSDIKYAYLDKPFKGARVIIDTPGFDDTYVFWKATMTKMGPNDARRVVWAISKFFFSFVLY